MMMIVGQVSTPEEAKEIEKQASLAGRKFIGTLTKLPSLDWAKEVDGLEINEELKEKVKSKLKEYLKRIS